MKFDIERIAQSLLWENVSNYIEQIEELQNMMKDISYIDKGILDIINSCEILETEEFCVVGTKEEQGVIWVEFEMPFVLYCWKDKKQLLRVTAWAYGICEIPDGENYDYSLEDFSNMGRLELIESGNIVKICNVNYKDVEVDECL